MSNIEQKVHTNDHNNCDNSQTSSTKSTKFGAKEANLNYNENRKTSKTPISIQKYIKASYEYIIPYAFAFIIFFLIEFLVYGAENNDIGRNSLSAVFVSTDTLNIILSLLLSEAIQRIICKSGSVAIWIALISGLIFYIVFKLIAVFSINNIVLNISGMINLAYLICTMIFVAKGAWENARIKTQS